MESYSVHRITTEIMIFIENLVNWYIKFNRNRIKGRYYSIDEQSCALSTLYKVLLAISKIFAPFMPFLAETIYQKLKVFLPKDEQVESVHLSMYPLITEFSHDDIVERRMANLQKVSYMIRASRSRSTTAQSIKIPLKSVTIAHDDPEFLQDIVEMEKYLLEEINTLEIKYCNQQGLVKYKILPNHKKLGQTYKQLSKLIIQELYKISNEVLYNYKQAYTPLLVLVNGTTYVMDPDDFTVGIDLDFSRNTQLNPHELWSSENNIITIINTEFDDTIKELHIRRLFVTGVQEIRKRTKLRPWNKINIYYETDEDIIIRTLQKYCAEIVNDLGYSVRPFSEYKVDEKIIVEGTNKIYEKDVKILISDPYNEIEL